MSADEQIPMGVLRDRTETINQNGGMQNAEKGGIGILGMSRYVSLFLPTEEKVKVIENVKSIDDELEKVSKGLGFTEGYSIANVGETAITGAAMAIVKLAIQYKLNLSNIKNLWYSTETPSSLAANDAVAIRDAVNKLARVLREKGIADIGRLDPEDMRHNQSACVSGVESLFSISAVGGISGDTLIVTSDVAYYKWGSKEDETGGYGSTAIYVGNIDKNASALRITQYRGSSQSDNPDFDKRVLKDSDERTGIAKVAKYPIVFGPYSEIKYMLNAFVAIEKALNSKGIDINAKNFFDTIVFAGHTPYPAMPQKALANLIIHFARVDAEFREKIMSEIAEAIAQDEKLSKKYKDTKIEIPYIDGFETQRETFEFILDVEGLIFKLKQESEASRLSGNNGSTHNAPDKSRMKARALLDCLAEYRDKYNIKKGGEIDRLFEDIEAKLDQIKSAGGSLSDLINAFSKIEQYVDSYINRNKDFNSMVRQTKTYKAIAKKMNIEESLKLSRSTGNIYTGSAFQSLMSLVAYSNPEELEGKHILFTGFGSKEGAYVILLEPQNIKGLAEILLKNAEFDRENREKITAEEYRSIRVDGNFDRIKPIIADTGDILQNDLFAIDREKAAEYFGRLNALATERRDTDPIRETFRRDDLQDRRARGEKVA
ncbi:MAG: hydroxymethylglutaryl-CoA synthase [Candidatus Micrarchaeaceae archaeon]